MTMRTRNAIVLSADPKGHFIEGIIDGTPKPGQMVQIKAGVEPDDGGRLTYEVFNGAADGERDEVLILCEDAMQGKLPTSAYVDGDRCFIYAPLAGDELQVLAANLTGTGSGTDDAFAIGDKLIVDDGTGKFIKTTGSPESEPFKVIETVTTLLGADQLIPVRCTGR
jgi:hypothetical protein